MPDKPNICFQSIVGEPITTVIVGDSHAQALFPGLVNSIPDRNIGLFVSGYAPLLSNSGFRNFFNEINADIHIKTVIMSAYWIASTAEFVPKGSSLGLELERAISFITQSGKKVYIMVDNHSFSFPPEACQYSRFLGKGPKCSEDISAFFKQLNIYIDELRRIESSNPNVKVLDPSSLLCDEHKCSMIHNGRVLLRDKNHLSLDGSYYFGSWIASKIEK